MKPTPIIVLIACLLALLSAAPAADARAQSACGYDAGVAAWLAQTSQSAWVDWLEKLTGKEAVWIGSEQATIQTRFSFAMFNGQANARAYDFVLAQLRAWHYPEAQIEQHVFLKNQSNPWKNLALTVPGSSPDAPPVFLTAHLDDTSGDAWNVAPGAEDNASGAAALLEAARMLRTVQPTATLKLIWFTGEEQGLLGSQAYVRDHTIPPGSQVINLDMFGYDDDNDRCFELHVGEIAESHVIGACVMTSIDAYNLDLSADFITSGATTRSDHAVFWGLAGVGAVEVLENYDPHPDTFGCEGRVDRNPNYHQLTDTIDKLNLPVAFDIARAGLAAAAGLAAPLEACFSGAPSVAVTVLDDQPRVTWSALPGASGYRIYRSETGCDGRWLDGGETGGAGLEWTDAAALPGRDYRYRVEAIDTGGACVSAPSACSAGVSVQGGWQYLPLVER